MIPVDQATETYEAIWSFPAYAEHSPGVAAIDRFLRVTDARPPDSIADLGCGTGLAGQKFAELGFDVMLVDLVSTGLHVSTLPFLQQCLWDPPNYSADYGFCVDVIEHLPPEYVLLAIDRMWWGVNVALYLEIATVPDQFGVLVDGPLHLTVKPFVWWRDRIGSLGHELLHGIDLLDRAVFVLGS